MRFILLIAILASLFMVGTMATCGACCSTGNCLTAFRGTEGVCCGVRAVDEAFSKPYCCPSNAKCIDDNSGGYKCQLLSVDNAAAATAPGANTTTNTRPNSNAAASAAKKSNRLKWWHWLLIGLGCAAALAGICWGIYRFVKHRQYSKTEQVMMAHNQPRNRNVDVRL